MMHFFSLYTKQKPPLTGSHERKLKVVFFHRYKCECYAFSFFAIINYAYFFVYTYKQTTINEVVFSQMAKTVLDYLRSLEDTLGATFLEQVSIDFPHLRTRTHTLTKHG